MKTLIITSAAISCLLFTSCAGVVQGDPFRGPISGVLYTEDGAKVDGETVSTLVSKFKRLLGGEKLPNVILTPVK